MAKIHEQAAARIMAAYRSRMPAVYSALISRRSRLAGLGDVAPITATAVPTSANWFSELLKDVAYTAKDLYVDKITAEQQAKNAKSIAESEVKKMQQQVAIQQAEANTIEKAAALQKEQTELQRIMASLKLDTNQKLMLGGFVLLGLVVFAMTSGSKKRGRAA